MQKGCLTPKVPLSGRWLTRDSIAEGGGSNLYAYLNNDALNFIDYLGNKRKTLGDRAEDGAGSAIEKDTENRVDNALDTIFGQTCDPMKDGVREAAARYASCEIRCVSKTTCIQLFGGSCLDKKGMSSNLVKAQMQCMKSGIFTVWKLIGWKPTPTGCSAQCHSSCKSEGSPTYDFP